MHDKLFSEFILQSWPLSLFSRVLAAKGFLFCSAIIETPPISYMRFKSAEIFPTWWDAWVLYIPLYGFSITMAGPNSPTHTM